MLKVDRGRLKEIKARRSKITPAPWHAPGLGEVHSDHDNGIYVRVYAGDDPRKHTDECMVADGCAAHDAEFIANAPSDIDYLWSIVIQKLRGTDL